jgi:hypothetical protein
MQVTQGKAGPASSQELSGKANAVLRYLKSEFLQAVFFINLSLVLFFSTPIFTPNSYYLPVDTLQRSDSKLIDLPPYPGKYNAGYIDSLQVFQPQLHYSRERLEEGQFPLWNPYNANGLPHFASLQSAVLSPYSLPVYLFGLKDGWLLSQYLKLLMLALFTYGFLGLIGIRHWIRLICAIAFTYSGYNITWLLGPHIASLILLPAGLFFVERALQSQAKESRGLNLNLAALSLTLACSILGGHIETTFFSGLMVGAYFLLRLWLIPTRIMAKFKLVLAFAGAGLLGIGLAAIQLVPFVEYLLNWIGPERSERQYLELNRTITNLFPTIFGLPNQEFVDGPGIHPPELFLSYVGAAFIFLTLCGPFLLRKNPYFWFFGLFALFMFGYSYNLYPFNVWLGYLPGLKEAVAQRSSLCITFGLSTTTALVLNELYTRRLRWQALVALGLGGLFFIGTALAGAFTTFTDWKIDTTRKVFQDYIPGQLFFVVEVFLVALLGSLLLTRGRVRAAGVGLLLVVSFAQSGWLLKDVNGTADARYAFPQTDGTQAIQNIAGQDNVAFYKDSYLPPLDNLFYDIHDLRFFDALWIRPYETLFNRAFDSHNIYSRYIYQVSPHSLQLMGAQYVVATASPDALLGKNRLAETTQTPQSLNRATLEQTFVAEQNNLSVIAFYTTTYGRYSGNPCQLEFTLAEAATPDKPLRKRNLPCAVAPEKGYLNVSFEPVADSAGKSYRFTLASPDASKFNTIGVFLSPKKLEGSQLSISGKPDDFLAIVQPWYNNPNSSFSEVWHNDRFSIYRFDRALPRYYSVGGTRKTETSGQLLDLLFDPKFDFSRAAALPPETSLAALSGTEYAPAQVVAEEPERKVLNLTRNSPGFLVTSLTNYPGWKVKINGVETPVVRTNYAFIGVPVPGGSSRLEIYYDPLSFKLGLALSALCLLAVAGWLVWGWRSRTGKPELP